MDSYEWRRRRWYDRWLVSSEQEELETSGPSVKGRRIIEELNQVYERTGILRRFVRILGEDIERVSRYAQRPVKILDIGMRDGNLLNLIGEYGSRKGIEMELHGVEFREDLAVFANKCCNARGDKINVHHDPSRHLEGIAAPASFDIVCSTFMLHHLTPNEAIKMLAASDQAARGSVIHLDIARSIYGVALIWVYYTLSGCFESRKDSVLSCRRALTRCEAAHLIKLAGGQKNMIVTPLFPLYHLLRRQSGAVL